MVYALRTGLFDAAMMHLDPSTFAVAGAFLVSVLTVLGVAIFSRRPTLPGSGRWALANALIAVSFFIVSQRPATTNWSNVLFVAGMILAVEGNRAFRGLPPRIWWLYPSGAIAVAAGSYAEYMHDPNARNVSMALFHSLVSTISVVTLVRHSPPARTVALRFTALMYGLFGAVNVIRAVYFLSVPRFPVEPGVADIFIRSPFSLAFYFSTVLLIVCCSIGWLMMTDERLLTELMEQGARLHATAERAAAANAAKSEFLMILGHEIRNPLSAVMTLTDLVLDTPLTADQREYETAVRTSIEALLRVTDDILDLSKIESGRLTIESSPFDIVALISGIVKVFTPLAQEKKLDLVVNFDSKMPSQFLGDGGRIRQVITNLVGNALKFTKQGQIHIGVECERLPGPQTAIRISVTDSGIGIAPEAMGRLFEKFSRAHDATSHTHGGTGIGLVISKRLIELMGGRLAVDSEIGKGSTFWFELNLPLADQAARAHSST